MSTVDDCGVCRGDGSTCLPKKGQKKTVTGEIALTLHLDVNTIALHVLCLPGNSVFTLPAMSAKIDIVIRDMDLSILCYLGKKIVFVDRV